MLFALKPAALCYAPWRAQDDMFACKASIARAVAVSCGACVSTSHLAVDAHATTVHIVIRTHNDVSGAIFQMRGCRSLTRGAAQGLRGALHLPVQLPAVARVDRRLQPVHLRHQRVRVRAGLRQLCADLRHACASVQLASNAALHPPAQRYGPATPASHACHILQCAAADAGNVQLPDSTHLLEVGDHGLDLVQRWPDVVVHCWPIIQCRLLSFRCK